MYFQVINGQHQIKIKTCYSRPFTAASSHNGFKTAKPISVARFYIINNCSYDRPQGQRLFSNNIVEGTKHISLQRSFCFRWLSICLENEIGEKIGAESRQNAPKLTERNNLVPRVHGLHGQWMVAQVKLWGNGIFYPRNLGRFPFRKKIRKFWCEFLGISQREKVVPFCGKFRLS